MSSNRNPSLKKHGVTASSLVIDDEELMRDRLASLLEGQHLLVNTGDMPEGIPPWYDENKFKIGQEFAKKYRGGIFFAHLMSLTLLVYSPQVLKPLIFTGKSETPRKSYRRYISTAMHVMSWYGGDIWRSNSQARQSLKMVRQFHSDNAVRVNSPDVQPSVDAVNITDCGQVLDQGRPVNQAIQEDLKSLTHCPFLHLLDDNYKTFHAPSARLVPYFNQLDMSGTQYAFIGLIVMHPDKFGMARATDEELEGFIHLWRCLGWILGIDDRFNFCQSESLAKSRQWTLYFTDKIALPLLSISVTPEYEHMGRAIADGARHYVGASYESYYLYIGWVLGLPMPRLKERVSKADYFSFKSFVFIFGFLSNLPFGNYLVNGLNYLVLKLITDPPSFWPRRYRPPHIPGLKQFWDHS